MLEKGMRTQSIMSGQYPRQRNLIFWESHRISITWFPGPSREISNSTDANKPANLHSARRGARWKVVALPDPGPIPTERHIAPCLIDGG